MPHTSPLSIELIPDPDVGGFTACLPDIPAYGEGETPEAAIADLPFEQREAVRLRFLDEWTTTQIAQFLDTTERAVAGLLRRGIARLRDQLDDLQSPG